MEFSSLFHIRYMNKIQDLEIKSPKRLVYLIIKIQLLVTILVASIFWVFVSGKAAYSALVAGLICALANWYFTRRVFRYWGARAAKQFVIAFCFGELMKLVIEAVLVVIALLYFNVEFGPFLTNFIVSLLIYWLAPFFVFGLENNRN